MSSSSRRRYLQIVLVASGLVFVFGIAIPMRVWPAGFAWTPAQPEYEQMFVAVYVVLEIFLFWRLLEHDASLPQAGCDGAWIRSRPNS